MSASSADRGDLRLAELAELGVLTASLLHELRQPLFAVKGRLELAHHHRRPLDGEELLLLVDQVSHMEELLEHYAGLGRPDDTWAEVDLRVEIGRATEMLAHRVRVAQVEVSTRVPEAPLLVRGRAVALRQVVLNLFGNAVDAVAGREVRRVGLVGRRERDRVRLEVEDSGPGFAPEVVERLFQPFVTTKAPGRGTGLGLYIARRLAEEAGGTLQIESNGLAGARIVVELPAI